MLISNLDIIRRQACLSCGNKTVDPHHIKTRGSGGGDQMWNLMPLCRQHHSEVHQIGLLKFSTKYFNVSNYLDQNGWTVLNGKVIHIEGDQMNMELGE